MALLFFGAQRGCSQDAFLQVNVVEQCALIVGFYSSCFSHLTFSGSFITDVAFLQLLDDEFLRLMIVRFVFCFYVMHLHRAFKVEIFVLLCTNIVVIDACGFLFITTE